MSEIPRDFFDNQQASFTMPGASMRTQSDRISLELKC